MRQENRLSKLNSHSFRFTGAFEMAPIIQAKQPSRESLEVVLSMMHS